MAEYYIRVDLSTVPSIPLQVSPLGVPITGVVLNGPLPAGMTFKVCRLGAPDGLILAGAPGVGQGGDAATDYFCPPANPLAVLFSPAAPGQFADLVLISSGAEVSRV